MLTGQQDFVGVVTEGANQIANIFNQTNNKNETDTNQTTQTMKQAWTDYVNKVKEDAIDLYGTITDLAQTTVDALTTGFQTSFEALGALFVGGEEAAKNFFNALKEAGKEAVATILEALGKEFAIRAVAAALTGNFIAGAGWAAASAAAFTAAGFVRALQGGGSFSANEPILVGERGPELLIPGTPGEIIPNNQITNYGRSVVINNYNTINNASDVELLTRKMALRLDADRRGV
jgi:hypothetical protein